MGGFVEGFDLRGKGERGDVGKACKLAGDSCPAGTCKGGAGELYKVMSLLSASNSGFCSLAKLEEHLT